VSTPCVAETSLAALVSERVLAAGVVVDRDVLGGCAEYLSLLDRWNRRINLTSLPLGDQIPAATIDKLIVEPLMAAALFPSTDPTWFDLGTGGGSPAIPLRLARRGGSLTMVESRERKCAFLREAVRRLGLERTRAVSLRFEEIGASERADVVTIRAVRVDAALADALARLVEPAGQLFCFGTMMADERFVMNRSILLPDGSTLFNLSRRQAG
jgi:16S rRNA (guanine527-N7)-methyltransferase